MKCNLCGSPMKNGKCAFCGMSNQEENKEDGFNKHSIVEELKDLVKEEVKEKDNEPDDNYEPIRRHMYTEHYERRHIHNDSAKGGTVSSLMVKVVILLMLLLVMFYMFATDENGEQAPSDTTMVEEENVKFSSVIKCKGLIIGEEYCVNSTIVDAKTAQPILSEGTELIASFRFVADKEEMKIEVPFKTDISTLEVNQFVVITDVYNNNLLVAEYETLYMLNGKFHVAL